MDKRSSFWLYGIHFARLIVAAIILATPASAKSCSAGEAEAAQSATDKIDHWSELARVHQRFAHCDVGFVAEGNSEAVARLLVDRWAELPALVETMAKYPMFLRFVLRHIDSTLDTADLERIAELASSHCPARNKYLCTSLALKARRAMTP